MLLAFRFTAYTPSLAIPEKHTPSSSRTHSTDFRDSRRPRCWRCGDPSRPPAESPLPLLRSDEPIMSLQCEPGQMVFETPRPSVRRTGALDRYATATLELCFSTNQISSRHPAMARPAKQNASHHRLPTQTRIKETARQPRELAGYRLSSLPREPGDADYAVGRTF